ncbi:maltodextrin phosphorylase [Pyrococcus abyssi]|uniref:glycogen phosphorylase n=1 Tax=Pyrococcus abyssi (strain GE5 / Orsay) TaxID=272844 RepID=Q9V0Y2_PYRAB|nr:maltodextrin phosphorylase [Pyrococcus abyssi]CAB49570.1 Alpha-glucan phosphorylase [Pyrococcus abyssi GE5]CCE70042.1 TPA: Alpha-glucan phosphorylase [Pyrococcus abyssi GE5]
MKVDNSVKERILRRLPENISKLADLAYNYWWSWDTKAMKLWQRIDEEHWREYKNPVKLLLEVPESRLRQLSRDDSFLDLYELVIERFENYMRATTTWMTMNYPRWDKPIVYLCMEYGIGKSLPIYSGGLGILAGDHLKTASDLGLPLIAIGLLYKHGYFKQEIDRDGRQIEKFPEYNIREMPIRQVLNNDGTPLLIDVPIEDRIVKARVFLVEVGRVKLYLLDTDVPENREDDRRICDYLYNAEPDKRIKQEILIGIGGMRLLKALEIEPGVIHLNEGHPSFANFERIRWFMEKGLTFEEALELVRATSVFTTHTPVPAGHDVFPVDFVREKLRLFLRDLPQDKFLGLGKVTPEDTNFNMTVLSIRTSEFVNAVSKLHAKVTREMWSNLWPGVPTDEIPIDAITNGVHTPTWVNENLAKLYDIYIGKIWREHVNLEGIWYAIERIPDSELWEAHLKAKREVIELIRRKIMKRNERLGIDEPLPDIDENALIIGFARRFATYKRAILLFTDLERLKRIVNNPERPVYIIFGGKAHPMDEAGKEFLRRVYEVSQMPEFKGKIILIENYDMGSARILVSGVDVWLNTPRRPLEASGTSGMKAGLNGVINLSVFDGWWVEGYNGRNGWVIGDATLEPETEADDYLDAMSLYDLLENVVVPLYYENRSAWIRMMKESIMSIAPRFSTYRMVKEYISKFYSRAMETGVYLSRDNFKWAKELAKWKEKIRREWGEVEIEDAKVSEDSIEVTLRLGNLRPEDVRVELYYGVKGDGKIAEPSTVELRKMKELGDGRYVYSYSGKALKYINHDCWHYSVRVYAYHSMIPGKFLLGGYIKWKVLKN